MHTRTRVMLQRCSDGAVASARSVGLCLLLVSLQYVTTGANLRTDDASTALRAPPSRSLAAAAIEGDVETWAADFGQSLHALNAAAAATDALEAAYSGYTYRVDSDSTSQELFDALHASLTATVASRNAAVARLQQEVSAMLIAEEGTTTSPECCTLEESDVEYSSFFQKPVDSSGSCVRYSTGFADSTPQMTTPLDHTASLDDVFEELFAETPTLKWSYFGSQEGSFRIYPAPMRDSCTNYDPRFRPWFVSAATPEPKDLVLVADSSSSMLNGDPPRIGLAIDAAKVVLSTLNPSDYAALIDFDTLSFTPNGCYWQSLAQAVPRNIQTMNEFADSMFAQGGTMYVPAFEKAFDLLEHARESADGIDDEGLADPRRTTSGGRQAILFMTDGKPEERHSAILDFLAERNADGAVSILTFLLGEDLDDPEDTEDAIAILQSIANNNNGSFVHVPDGGDLRTAMGSYYDFFSEPNPSQDVVYAPPYFDASGLGLITTAALPVYVGTTLRGVVGVDLTIADLVAEAAFFGEGDRLSYAFIVDNNGKVLVHPLMPAPAAVEEPPTVMDISSFETSNGFHEVRADLLARETGSARLTVTRAFSRGTALKEGVRTVTFDARYIYAPIPQSPFMLCVVIADSDLEQPSLSSVPEPDFDEAFVYHRVDLLDAGEDGAATCSQFGSPSTRDASSVKFAPGVFSDSVFYMEFEETANVARQFHQFMSNEDISPPLPMLDEDKVRRDVWATSAADPVYRSASEGSVMRHTLWRYVATPNGVFRSFPAHPSAPNYDPRARPWWARAVAHPGELALSTPYVDASGGGIVTTISNIIRRVDNDAAPLEAVTGVDFTLGEFQSLLDEVVDCDAQGLECAVIDSSGLVVLSRDTLYAGESLSEHFIGDAYPVIAKDLVLKNVLRSESCNDFQDAVAQGLWQLDLQGETAISGQNIASSGCDASDEWAMAGIPGTNAFLLAFTMRACCFRWPYPAHLEAHGAPERGTEDLDFDECNGQFELTAAEAAAPTCPPDNGNRGVVYEVPVAHAGLQDCYAVNCAIIQTKEACLETVGCNLCFSGTANGDYTCKDTECDASAGSGASTSSGAPSDPCFNKDGEPEVTDLSGAGGSPNAGATLSPMRVSVGVVVAMLVAVLCATVVTAPPE